MKPDLTLPILRQEAARFAEPEFDVTKSKSDREVLQADRILIFSSQIP